MKAMLLENGGRYATLFGIYKDPYELIKYVERKNYQFVSGGHKLNHIETLFNDCHGVAGYGEGFIDFGDNLHEVSCAFSYRIYDRTMVEELKQLIKSL